MSQILKKFIGNNQVADEKIRLDNDNWLRARNQADSADVEILKVTASDLVEVKGLERLYAAGGTDLTIGSAPSGNSNIYLVPVGTGNVDVSSTKIINLVDPTSAQDAATKAYVDAQISGGSVAAKAAVRVVALSNLSLSGAATIDGVSVATNDRVLATAQTTGTENGVYAANTGGAWTRVTDLDASAEFVNGFVIWVAEGTNYGDSLWAFDNIGAFTLGSTTPVFKKLSPTFAKESLTLNGTDITNQYKDLALSVKNASLQLFVAGVNQSVTDDYTLSVVGGVTRITFAGGLATGGASELVSGDVLKVSYCY